MTYIKMIRKSITPEERIFKIKNFNEKEDVLLPNTIWEELLYICVSLEYILLNKKKRKQKWNNLKRQLRIYLRWMKVKD